MIAFEHFCSSAITLVRWVRESRAVMDIRSGRFRKTQ